MTLQIEVKRDREQVRERDRNLDWDAEDAIHKERRRQVDGGDGGSCYAVTNRRSDGRMTNQRSDRLHANIVPVLEQAPITSKPETTAGTQRRWRI